MRPRRFGEKDWLVYMSVAGWKSRRQDKIEVSGMDRDEMNEAVRRLLKAGYLERVGRSSVRALGKYHAVCAAMIKVA